ncbi:MAG: hypothetical protein HY898_34090 [Deltaproteobacteria bacterium]|nr:hypothetical protein [Deltaproteobacteria bacterium]
MKRSAWIAFTAAVSLGALWGCSGSDSASTLQEPGAGGAAGTGGGSGAAGNAGSATGGAAGNAGGATGGAAGNAGGAAGGAAGAAGGAAGGATGGAAGTGGAADWWPNAYDPNGTATVKSGEHNAGKDCLSCHTGQGEAPRWLFAGTIYDTSGTTPVAHAEVAVKDPTGFYSAFSGTNGNFWVPFTGTPVDWANAQVRARNSNGEVMMGGVAAAGCNSCHSASMPIKAP